MGETGENGGKDMRSEVLRYRLERQNAATNCGDTIHNWSPSDRYCVPGIAAL